MGPGGWKGQSVFRRCQTTHSPTPPPHTNATHPHAPSPSADHTDVALQHLERLVEVAQHPPHPGGRPEVSVGWRVHIQRWVGRRPDEIGDR